MIRATLLGLGIVAALSGCKIVAKTDEVPQDDAARMVAMVEGDWETRVLPRLAETAAPLTNVLDAMATDFGAAETQYGTGAATEGAPGTFAVRGEGTVVAADLKSRAARLSVDATGDGKTDVEVQLGPVIRGTALRDVLPFYVFTDFRDQIEFAKLARALNDKAHAGLPGVPADPVGRTVAFTGAFTLAAAGDPIEIVPVQLTWSAP